MSIAKMMFTQVQQLRLEKQERLFFGLTKMKLFPLIVVLLFKILLFNPLVPDVH